MSTSINLSALGCAFTAAIWPTMTSSGSHQSAEFSIPSTSRPASVSRSASCLVGRFRSTYSFNHEMGTRIVFVSDFVLTHDECTTYKFVREPTRRPLELGGREPGDRWSWATARVAPTFYSVGSRISQEPGDRELGDRDGRPYISRY